ncbi:ABC transporter ATP-binding protein [Chlorobium sp. N1]|uniref:ABC transporter ATP-binding protein n=1 Tax=Chlorobium sp. N1 TaxID=2491138 RepID=UPI00103ACF14|nr:ABC transporter ATP-binding protein [Chlorobium sp. N1]TCD48660.1 ABC transporter ATP-binding protein [Chlorobium sp. N1]
MKNLLSLWPYLSRYRVKLLAGFVFIILTNICAVIGPRYIRLAVDSMNGPFMISDVLRNAGLYVLFALLSGFFLFLVRQSIIVTSRHIEYDLKNDYYRHLQSLPRAFYNMTSTGELISRGTNDLNAVREFLGPGIMYSLNTFFRLLFALAAMISLSPKLTFFALLPAPILSWSVYRIGRSMQKRSKSIQESYAAITNLVQENLSGIRIVKSYTREAFEIERFEKLNEEYYGKNLSLGRLQALFFAFLTSLTAFSLLPVIWIGGAGVMEGTMTIGGIAQFIVYVTMLSWPIISIGWVTSIIQKASSAQARLDEIFAAEPGPETADRSAERPREPVHEGMLSFHDVSFSYPGSDGQPVLEHLSIDIEPGTKTAIVGATGSGKSSLVSLIPRLYDPTAGSITLGGRDIRTIPVKELRESIGFVPQVNFLFSDTIARNISWGSRESRVDAVLEASRTAMLHDDVQDFPDGFETMLGEKGINLSGGQKQRACIARAVAWKPSILILDDALSAVDTDTEAKLFDALLQQLPDTTVILISHRISTVKNCDRIIVLRDGRIAESGTHEELLSQEGIYFELYNQQLLEEEILSLS